MIPKISAVLIDRRQKRSTEGLRALKYHLVQTKERGGLEVVILVNQHGQAIAQAGDSTLCAELALIAPFYQQNIFPMRLPPLLRGGEISVHRVSLHGQEMFLASLGGGVARDALLSRSLVGVHRILTAN